MNNDYVRTKQVKLFNFYRTLSNLATNLLGVFVPIIIIELTGSLEFALWYLIASIVFRLVLNIALRKPLRRQAHIFNLIRVFPLTCKLLSLLLLDSNPLLAIILITVFEAFNLVCKHGPSEVIYNTTSYNQNVAKSAGYSQFYMMLGFALSQVLSGYFLESFPMKYLVVISIALYLISVVPLFIYYVNNKALLNVKDPVVLREKMSPDQKKTARKVMFGYQLVFIVFYCFDVLMTIFNIYLYMNTNSFVMIGIFSALFYLMQGITNIVFGRFSDHKNSIVLVVICCIILSACAIVLPFAKVTWLLYLSYIFYGLSYAVVNLYLYENMLSKTRLLQCSNRSAVDRFDGMYVAVGVPFFLTIAVSFIPTFIFIACCGVVSSVTIPLVEKHNVKLTKNFELKKVDIGVESGIS